MSPGTVYFTAANGFLSGGITDTVSVVTRQIEEYDPEQHGLTDGQSESAEVTST